VRHEELEALVDGVLAASPRGSLADQPDGLKRLMARWAADETVRTGRVITADEFYRRGKNPPRVLAPRPTAAQDERTDPIVAAVRQRG
jgi:hypothetical protein